MRENTSHNRRRWERRSAAIPISLVLEVGDVETDNSAITIDISPHGAKVQTKLLLVSGERLGVVFNREFPDAIPSRVAWVREFECSHWTLAGLEFLNTLAARR
jgi:hypothetical protein